jgi:hypothetical protein
MDMEVILNNQLKENMFKWLISKKNNIHYVVHIVNHLHRLNIYIDKYSNQEYHCIDILCLGNLQVKSLFDKEKYSSKITM